MRTKLMLAIILLGLVSTLALAQNAVLPATTSDSGSSFPKVAWPRPFIYGGLGLNGGGYAPMSGKVGTGLRIDQEHLIWAASAAYDNSHKSNENTIANTNGHERSLESSIYYRLNSGWFVGGGASWSQLSTTNYTKQDFHPSVGGGKDYFHQDCCRRKLRYPMVVPFAGRLQIERCRTRRRQGLLHT